MPTFIRHPVALALSVIALLLLIGSTVAIVPETRQGVVVRFGDPKKIVNRYLPNEDFGKTGAGIILRWPFVDQIVWIDKRVLSVEMERQQVLSTDQLRLQVDAFARYRIVDPLRMYIAAGNEERVSDALRPILGSALRNELGKRPFAALLSPERGQVMDNIEAGLNRVARQYGAEIVDVRIKRADLPDGAPLESAFTRMRTAREQEALTIRAQGAKQAQIIRAEADANAARIYSESFGKDPQFYDFYRAMQAYRFTFAPERQGSTSMLLSRENDFLKQFQGSN
ncbi:Membrane protease subunit HflC [Sphingobium herbicidovorans NBRC 16415]|jgi:modulator of FtsH protease HflC|uniref:Protein HflC n=1 Tax=Sphingobium herbicidovorans (strain ATCC 700291 / DSM 11019 / CCUG 56400 / KCTC 2939 / LMG 18315 / NBRC 16415 / MH) TaxID=1219045 RepID=A0A086PB97_SPHHM|nr:MULTISPECIES: protease modulator HflC [Sphingobium]AMK17147.1 membrane protease subunit HflC [Sphingobium sp. MI1205]KFG90665.1 Membrane protease subunit HflC [Sphingobium herbicidovorans NBRC 16415]